MAFTSDRLTNGGKTSHYQFKYDDSLKGPGGPEPARTNAVLAACEDDFNQMSTWFGGIALDVSTPIPVNVTQNGGGASWSGGPGSGVTITVNPAAGPASDIRYLLVSEMVEQFMRAQGRGWFGDGTEGSQGEGLSRFLAARLLVVKGLGAPPAGFDNSNRWLNSDRADFVNNINRTDDGPDAATGCSLLFIYYLFSQLGFTPERIVAAGANTLGGVYRQLTGLFVDPFPHFKALVDSYFPGRTTISGTDLDNPFPLNDVLSTPSEIVWHNSETNETQIWFYDGHRVVGRATVLGEDGNPAFVGPPFSIVATGGFAADRSKDIVWHNSETNETQIWFMDGNRLGARGTVLGEHGDPAFIGPPFSIVAAGDFNGDGMGDIVWHNGETNETQLWFMDRNKLGARATVLGEDGNAVFIGPPWRIVGAGDFNGDGMADILWHNGDSDETQLWFMDRNKLMSRGTVLDEDGNAVFIGPPWAIVGVGDFDLDGIADILWHNSETDETQVWFMDRNSISRRGTVLGEDGNAVFIGAPWHIVGASPFG
jgi:hypothetical protein